MSLVQKNHLQIHGSQRPKAATVFLAAFVAGAVAAVGLNRALDMHLAHSKPQVESEPIFVALHSLPQGSPVTVWDVALREWPKAMLPTTAMRAADTFDGLILKQPLREGQPILTIQLSKATPAATRQFAENMLPDADTLVSQPGPLPTASASAVERPVNADLVSSFAAPSQRSEIPVPPIAAVKNVSPRVVEQPLVDASPSVDHSQKPLAAALSSEPSVPAATDIDAEISTDLKSSTTLGPPLAVEKIRSRVTRYLVVPERIALEADALFTSSTNQSPQASKPRSPQPTTETPVNLSQRPSANQPQKIAPKTASKRPLKLTPEQSRQKQALATPAVKTQSPNRLETMFPNLSAGVDAVEVELNKIRRERELQPTRSPAVATQPAQKAAQKPAPQMDRSAILP